MIPCPMLLRDLAIQRGCPEDEVDEVWESHTVLVDKDGGNYGGRRFLGLVDKHVRDGAKAPEVARTDPAIEAARAAARKAKAEDDAEYAKTAVSLRTWVSDLRARYLDGELLEPHEQVLARGELPQGHEDAASWLMESLADVRTFDGKRPRRPDPCGHPGCGLPVHSWVGFGGRRYSSGRCSDHTPEQDWSIK